MPLHVTQLWRGISHCRVVVLRTDRGQATQASREIGRIQHQHSQTKLTALQQRQRLESRLADLEARRAAVEERAEAAERARGLAAEERDALAPDAEAAAGLRVARRALEQRLLAAQVRRT